MYQFFKSMQKVAEYDTTNYANIAELTNKLLVEAGCHKEAITLKNGKVRYRNAFTKPFDEVLVAKWYMYYKKLFIGKLSKHPEFKEYHVDIINDVFMSITRFGSPEKFKSGSVVTQYVNMSLGHRIGYVLYSIGSTKRLSQLSALEDYKKKTHVTDSHELSKQLGGWKSTHSMKPSASMTHMAYSLDQLSEDVNFQLEDSNNSNSIINCANINILKDLLKDNLVGLKLLDACLYCDKKIVFSKICDYIKLDKSEYTDQTKQNLIDAYNIIASFILDTLNKDGRDISKYKINRKLKIAFEETTKKCTNSSITQCC